MEYEVAVRILLEVSPRFRGITAAKLTSLSGRHPTHRFKQVWYTNEILEEARQVAVDSPEEDLRITVVRFLVALGTVDVTAARVLATLGREREFSISCCVRVCKEHIESTTPTVGRREGKGSAAQTAAA